MKTNYYPITWAGEDNTESLDDVLTRIRVSFPGIEITETEWKSGGWPVYGFTFPEGLESEVVNYLEGGE